MNERSIIGSMLSYLCMNSLVAFQRLNTSAHFLGQRTVDMTKKSLPKPIPDMMMKQIIGCHGSCDWEVAKTRSHLNTPRTNAIIKLQTANETEQSLIHMTTES